MKQTIILGNIITVDEKKPFAKAAVDGEEVFKAWSHNCLWRYEKEGIMDAGCHPDLWSYNDIVLHRRQSCRWGYKQR